jgi:hypothetical protein
MYLILGSKMEAAQNLDKKGVNNWEILKSPRSDIYIGLPELEIVKKEYPQVDFEMLIEDLDKGKPHPLPQKGKSAVIIGRKDSYRGPDKKLPENIYLIEIEGKDSAFIFLYNNKYPMIHALETDKGIYLNANEVGKIPDIIESGAEVRVGARRFKITHKYSL